MSMAAKEFNDTASKDIHILIVEDEAILAMNLQESVEALGFTVVDITSSGETAIEKAIALHPDLILMDIRLQGEMDGIQAAEHIWNLLQIPIIYVTGHSDESTVERATLTFPFGYILKPIREKELHVAIQTALNRYEREQFMSTVLRQMGDGVIVVDSDFKVKYLNQIAEALTEWTHEEARGRPIHEVIAFIDEATQEPIQNPLISAFHNKSTFYLEDNALLIQKNGGLLPVTDSAVPIKDNRGTMTGAVLVFRDDSRRRLQLERNLAHERAQQLETQMAELQRLDQLKDDFLATTSHELRTPLASIKLAVCMLETVLNRQDAPPSGDCSQSEAINRYLKILQDQCDQELRLVNDLLDMRSLDANAYPLDLTLIDLEMWLLHVMENFQDRIKLQHQTLQFAIAQNTTSIISDRTSLTRIMTELLNNACKYTPKDGQIRITLQQVEALPSHLESFAPNDAQSQPHLQLEISNSGAEIQPEELSRIFEPFYRIPNNDPWKHGGTGLGLALVKKLVEYLNGKINATSNQSWTTFTIFLPILSLG